MQDYLLHLRKLGLGPDASMAEVKSAFRKKAKHLHPDVNPSASAKDEFARLRFSYDFILSFRNTKRTQQNYKKREPIKKDDDINLKKKYGTHKNWDIEETRKKRADAQERAENLKQEYLASEEYTLRVVFNHFFNYVALFLLMIIIGLMIKFPLERGLGGFLTFPILFAIGFPLWWAYVRKTFKDLSIEDFRQSLSQVSKTYKFWTYTMVITSFIIFFTATMRTVVSSSLIISLFLLLGIGAKYVTGTLFKYKKNKQNYISIGLIPFALSLLFLTNFVLSHSPKEQKHAYQFSPYKGEPSSMAEGLIYLEDGVWADEYLLRMYFEKEVQRASHIVVKTEKGLFGIDVLKEYNFSGNR